MVNNPIHVLLVEDDQADAELTMEALKESKIVIDLQVAADGVEALEYVHKKGAYAHAARPDLILLDLNLPRKNGRDVLRELKNDDALKQIPVVILTTSQAETDILKTYDLGANCYITKPVGLDQFAQVVKAIENFWFKVVKLPIASLNKQE